MHEFTQIQAALFSNYDERGFRSLVDKRIILPSPATRNFGRGKLKTFMRDEVRVASLLRRLDVGLSVYQQAGITDWIRIRLADVLWSARKENPPYIILETDISGDDWRGTFSTARGDINGWGDSRRESADMKISIMIDGYNGIKRPMYRFVAVNVLEALWWDDDEVIHSFLTDPTSDAKADE